MSVENLINQLKQLDKNKDVRVGLEGNFETYEIIGIDFNSDENEVYLEFRTDD